MSPHAVALALYGALSVGTLAIVAVVDAPYGRYERRGFGPRLPARAGWLLMESPACLGAAAFFLLAPPEGLVPWLLFGAWQVHYGYRALVYPWLMRARGKRMPVLVVVLGFAFNVLNAWLNMRALALGSYAVAWLSDPRFVTGLALFGAGWLAHVRSDQLLRGLRRPGERHYAIPRGFLFRWVSCPNYLGEMVQWLGWALMTWSGAGFGFALYTAANLGPRAVAHHRWYRATFEDYPADRRALIPLVL